MTGIGLAALTLLYPFLVHFAHDRIEPRWLAMILLAIGLMRLPAALKNPVHWFAVITPGLLAVLTWTANGSLPVKLYPVLVNAGLLLLFGWSLITPPTMIERLARLQEPDLPPHAVAYTRKVTQVWVVFFVVNGSIALFTAVWASQAVWTLYNGVIAYVLIALLFGIEWLVRQRVKRKFADV